MKSATGQELKVPMAQSLLNDMFEHSTHFGAEYLYGNVVKVEDGEEYKTIICEDGTEYKAKAVIVATGSKSV